MDSITPPAEPCALSATEAAAAVRDGRMSAEDLVRSCLDRAAARHEATRAWDFLDPDLALQAARAADRAFAARGPSGPLHGVPVGLKDVIDTYDMPSQRNSPIHAGRRPYADAACAALIRGAGGLILGKTATTEFANRHPGPARHPLDAGRTPGGSSSGSAAAVADRQVPLALGTQTSGSMIRPAAYCGIWGYKPTFGEISRVGVFQQSGSLDTLGLCARSLADLVLLRAVLARVPHEAIAPADAPPRLAVCRLPEWREASPEAQSILERGAATLSAAGAVVTDLDLPSPLFDGWEKNHRRIANFESARNFGHEKHRHADGLSAALLDGRIRDGERCSLDEYVAAQRRADHMRSWAEDTFAEFDAVLTLPAAGVAPVGLQATGTAAFCSLWTLLYTPCLTLPFGSGEEGMPLGLQLVGRRHADEALFAVAGWVETALLGSMD